MKNSNDTIGNRTRDLPTCSAVPQPAAPPRTPLLLPLQELFRKGISKCTVALVHATTVYKVNRGVAPLILKLGALAGRGRSRSRPGCFLHCQELRYASNTRLGESQIQSGRFGEHKKISFPCPNSNPELCRLSPRHYNVYIIQVLRINTVTSHIFLCAEY